MRNKPESRTIANYLQAVAHELRAVPADARADELREIEAHLRALVLASQQLEDVSDAEATAMALRQFGAPKRVGRNLRRAWERGQPEAWWRMVLATFFALGFFVVLVQPFLLGFYSFYMGLHGIDLATYQPMGANAETLAVFESMRSTTQFLAFLLTVIMTYFMGRISPKRGKFAIVILLVCAFWPVVTNRPDLISPWVLTVMLNLIVAGAFGCWLGARHALKRAARVARTR